LKYPGKKLLTGVSEKHVKRAGWILFENKII